MNSFGAVRRKVRRILDGLKAENWPDPIETWKADDIIDGLLDTDSDFVAIYVDHDVTDAQVKPIIEEWLKEQR